MKTLFDRKDADELKSRLQQLRPDSKREWGKMNPAQALAHTASGVELALGEWNPPRLFIGRLLGGFVKRIALRDDAPFKKNSPTDPGLIVADERDFETERRRLRGLIDRLIAKGPGGCTAHPHPFFGRLTGAEWGVLTYKHINHHLRQFGV